MTPQKPHYHRDWTYEPWQDHPHIACRGASFEIFFPDSSGQEHAREAKQICARCPVQSQCLGWALRTKEPFGIFGGMTAREREQLLDGQRLRR